MAKATITVCDACEKMASRVSVELVTLVVDIGNERVQFEFDSHMRDRCIWNNLRRVRPALTERIEKLFPASVVQDGDEDDADADKAGADEGDKTPKADAKPAKK